MYNHIIILTFVCSDRCICITNYVTGICGKTKRSLEPQTMQEAKLNFYSDEVLIVLHLRERLEYENKSVHKVQEV
jgi:hypothetical protein